MSSDWGRGENRSNPQGASSVSGEDEQALRELEPGYSYTSNALKQKPGGSK